MVKYDVILADPPWRYSDNIDNHPKRRTATKHYPTMKLKDICNLPVKNLVNKNCALFLWVTWPTIQNSFDVISSWGFEYKTIAWVWVKMNKSGFGYFYGTGYYARANTEPCLLAIKGSMPPVAKNVQSLIAAPIMEHSKKPYDQYSKINRLYPNAKKLELFARRPVDGWDVWGNEVNSNVELAL